MLKYFYKFGFEAIASLFFSVVMGYQRETLYKDLILYCFSLIGVSCYLFFLKEGRDVFDLLFPNLLSYEVNNLLWKNFMLTENLIQFLLVNYVYHQKFYFLNQLKALME